MPDNSLIKAKMGSTFPLAISVLDGGLLALVLASAALIGGITGFGFPAIGAISMTFLPASMVIPLLMVLSMLNQLLSMSTEIKVKPLRQWWLDGPAPYLIGGIVGVPIGVAILKSLPHGMLLVTLGLLLMMYALYFTLRGKPPSSQKPTHWAAAMAVGAAGGLVGGFSAFPSAAVVIWASHKGMSKSDTRGILQPYILSMQAYSLTLLSLQEPSAFTPQFWSLLGVMLPIIVPCTLFGLGIYRKISDKNFKRIGMALLAAAGITLFAKGACAQGLLQAIYP